MDPEHTLDIIVGEGGEDGVTVTVKVGGFYSLVESPVQTPIGESRGAGT